ncbi:MAG TPA: MFS transporter, partial [Steroidobacteraceae bacterium]
MSTRRQALVTLGAIYLAALAMPLSFTGPAVALPSIARAVSGGPLALAWVSNAFMLSWGSCLMVAGALADRFGRKRMFVIGVTSFASCSAALSFSPNIVWLDLLRALQGIAGAVAFAGGLAALAQEFEGPARTRAFSVLGSVFGIGLAFGPMLAGWEIQQIGWRAVFLSVTVLASGAALLGAWYMKESRDPDAQRLDWRGAAASTVALTLMTWGVLRVPESGWRSIAVEALLGGALVAMVAFVRIEIRTQRPMLDLSLFRYPRFWGVQFLATAPAYSYVVLLVLLPIRLIGIDGYGDLKAGQMMIALSAPMLIVPIGASVLTRWFSSGLICGTGLAISAMGLVWLAGADPARPAETMILPMLVVGMGISLPWGLMDSLAVSIVPKERAGMAIGIFNTTRIAGEGIAMAVTYAVLAELAASTLRNALPAGYAPTILSEAGHRLAMGDWGHSIALLPGISRDALLACYTEAFHRLMYMLA